MDLQEYARTKYALADIVRAIPKVGSDERHGAIADLFAQLAEDRFIIAIVGHFNRGKSSLMNALLRTTSIPTGIVPLTSVITEVRYGTTPTAIVRRGESDFRLPVTFDELPRYATEEGNPGNRRGVAAIELQVPAELLRRGFVLVDTPGLGSSIVANSVTTRSYLPNADAVCLVTSYEAPLSADEYDVLKDAVRVGMRTFVIVNKQDLGTATDRERALAFVREHIVELGGGDACSVYSTSALSGMEANECADEQRRMDAGITDLETAIVEFVLAERATTFVRRMGERVDALLHGLPPSSAVDDLRARLARVVATPGTAARPPLAGASSAIGECSLCRRISEAGFAFFRHYQYLLTVDAATQQVHARRGGFCRFHTWQYASLASPQGIAKALPLLLEEVAAALAADETTRAVLGNLGAACPCCEAEGTAEHEGLVSILRDPQSDSSAYCLWHLRVLAADRNAADSLRARMASNVVRLSEDLRGFALKYDALRRQLLSDDERRSVDRALRIVGSLRSIAGPLQSAEQRLD